MVIRRIVSSLAQVLLANNIIIFWCVFFLENVSPSFACRKCLGCQFLMLALLCSSGEQHRGIFEQYNTIATCFERRGNTIQLQCGGFRHSDSETGDLAGFRSSTRRNTQRFPLFRTALHRNGDLSSDSECNHQV